MQKTSNYSLKKPDVQDPLRVEDFNENADIIDAVLGELRNATVRVGSYAGDGTSGRTVQLGFTPHALILITQYTEEGKAVINFSTEDFAISLSSYSIGINDTRCVEGGVYLPSNTHNDKTYSNYYIAFV